MKKKPESDDALSEWKGVPGRIDKAIRGLTETQLNVAVGSDGWTIRESVHHLVEANLVASNMIIAALATDGYEYDWTWVNPGKAWMHRVGYDSADVKPAISTLRSLVRYIGGLVAANPGALARQIKLRDAPGAAWYSMTIEEILRQEVAHAGEHLGDIAEARKSRENR